MVFNEAKRFGTLAEELWRQALGRGLREYVDSKPR